MKRTYIIAVLLLGSFFIVNGQVPFYVPDNGLVAWWPFSGNVNDDSGNGLHGINYGASLTSDRFGNVNGAYSFDGYYNYIKVLNDTLFCFQGVNEMSISYWINATSLSSSKLSLIVNKQVGHGATQDGWNSNIQLNYASNFRIQSGIDSIYCDYSSGANSIITDTFYHVVQTYGNDQQKIYINGILVGQNTCIGSIGDNASDLYIGKPTWTHGNVKGFHGIIDDIGMWNRVLKRDEIEMLYEGCRSLIDIEPDSLSVNVTDSAHLVLKSNDLNATYQWQSDVGFGFQNLIDGGQYNGVQSDSLTILNTTLFNDNSLYRCIVQSGSCIDTSLTALLSVIDHTPIMNLENCLEMKVYPNPFTGTFLVLSCAGCLGFEFNIQNLSGQVVFIGRFESDAQFVDLENCERGVYIISIRQSPLSKFRIIKI